MRQVGSELGDRLHPARTVGCARHEHDGVERRGDLMLHRRDRQRDPGEQHQRLQPAQRVGRIVRVHRGE